MKKFHSIMIMLMFCMISLSSSAENVITVKAAGEPGETAELEIALANDDPIVAFQMAIVLPEGFDVALNKKQKLDVVIPEDRADDHTATSALNEGVLSVVTASLSNAEFYENEGAILVVKIKIPESAKEGGYPVEVKNIVLSGWDATEKKAVGYKVEPVKGTIVVGDPTGISSVKAESVKSVSYNLAGQKVNDTFKGVVVKNGKKVVIK